MDPLAKIGILCYILLMIEMFNSNYTGYIMANTPKFTVLFEKLRGQTFQLDKDVLTIGRKDGMDIVLKDGSVSGFHAELFRSEEDGKVVFTLRDHDSTNGTRVNNQPITEHVLQNSDLITFGNVEVLFDGERNSAGNTSDFSHLTHTIDIGSLDKNTTAPQVLTNFNPQKAKKAQKDALFQRSLMITLGLVGVGLVALAVSVLVKIIAK